MMLLEVLCFLIGNLARNFDTKMFSVQNAKYAVHSGALQVSELSRGVFMSGYFLRSQHAYYE